MTNPEKNEYYAIDVFGSRLICIKKSNQFSLAAMLITTMIIGIGISKNLLAGSIYNQMEVSIFSYVVFLLLIVLLLISNINSFKKIRDSINLVHSSSISTLVVGLSILNIFVAAVLTYLLFL